jgi:hypothetical protein
MIFDWRSNRFARMSKFIAPSRVIMAMTGVLFPDFGSLNPSSRFISPKRQKLFKNQKR